MWSIFKNRQHLVEAVQRQAAVVCTRNRGSLNVVYTMFSFWRGGHDRIVQPWLISNLMHKILIYLRIIYLLKSSTCFEHYPAHLQEVYVIIVYTQPLVSSLSAGDCSVHRLRKSSFLTGAQDSHLQRVTIPETAYIQLRRRPPEDEQGNARNM